MLEALEASLDAREATIFDGAPPPEPVALPDSLPPLPTAHAARAQAVLDSLDAQEEHLRDELARIRLEIARVTRAEAARPRGDSPTRRGAFDSLA